MMPKSSIVADSTNYGTDMWQTTLFKDKSKLTLNVFFILGEFPWKIKSMHFNKQKHKNILNQQETISQWFKATKGLTAI